MSEGKFFIAKEREIIDGKASDVYFSRTLNLVMPEKKIVVAEITSSVSEQWINFTGLEEVTNLLEGRNIDVWAIPEGTLMATRDSLGRSIPFIVLRGNYSEIMENSIIENLHTKKPSRCGQPGPQYKRRGNIVQDSPQQDQSEQCGNRI